MRTTVLLMAGIAAVGMMASCASDNGDSPNNGKGEKATINLSFATNGSTRTSGIATTNGDDPTKDEGKLNNLEIGLFDDGGNRVSAKNGNTESTDYSYSSTGPTQISTTSNATKVAVIANVPTSTTTNLGATKTYSAFGSDYPGLLANTTSTDGTSAQDGTTNKPYTVNSQQITGLPMYGEKPITWSNTSSNVTVTLTRMVARVCLTKLVTDFTNYADPNATFVPTEVFMYNVKDKLTNWQTGTTDFTASETGGNDPGLCEMTDKTNTTPASVGYISPLTDYAYLSSGSAVPAGWVSSPKSTDTHGVTYFNCAAADASALSFYVFPNTNTSAPTKIIIKGIFTTGVTSAIVYYPIIINHASSYNTITGTDGNTYPASGSYSNDSKISANTIYNLQVTIEGRGVAEPSMPLEPSTVNATMQVTPWGTTTQEVTIP